MERKSIVDGEAKPLDESVENNFKYHAPSEKQQEHYGKLRESGKDLAYEILDRCPASREKSIAMTRLEEAVMWANAAIARNSD